MNFVFYLQWKWISFRSIASMAGTIKPFQFLQHLYQMMGILSPKPSDIFSMNPKKLFILMGMITLNISLFGYFLFETTFAQDYGESFYGFITKWITLVDFIVTVWKMPTILRLIKMYEKFIERSEWTKYLECSNIFDHIFAPFALVGLHHESTSKNSYNPMYGDLVDKIERISKFIYTVLIEGTIPASTISFTIITLNNLYVLDLGSDSYKDVLLMWVWQ